MVSVSQTLVSGLALCATTTFAITSAESTAVPEATASNHSVATTDSVSGGASIKSVGFIVWNKRYTFSNYNWNNAQYVCAWWHHRVGYGSAANIFIKRWDGDFNQECWCKTDMSMYDPWGSRWTRSTDTEMVCYTRDGRTAKSVRHKFDSVDCGKIPLYHSTI